MKKNDLSIIILNYKTKDFLQQCLKSLKNSQTGRYEIETIVVDNHSQDGSAEMVKEKFSWAKLVANKNNLGFAKGNNFGIGESAGRYVLFLNPDTIVFPGTLEEMVSFMDRNPRVGAATCRLELPDGGLDDSCHRGFPTPWNAFCHFSLLERLFPTNRLFSGYSLGFLPKNKIHEIDAGCGAFLIIRREVGEDIGWWDEDYFWYGEDLDLCYRIKEKGWKIFFVPKVKVIHYKGASSGGVKKSSQITTATKQTRLRSARSSMLVMRIFYQKHYLNKYPRFISWLVMRGIDLVESIRITRIK